MSFQKFCRRNAIIAVLCGIPVAHVSEDQRFGYEMGWMEEGARSPRWLASYLRDREPVLSVAPYTVSPTRYAAVGEPFPDDAQWPSPLPTLLTEGSGGNG